MRLEMAQTEPHQGALHAVDQASALADQRLALAARPPVVFGLECRHRRHPAVITLAAQPAEKGAFQQLDIEPIGLRPTMLARDRHARSMDDMSLDAARSQPAGQPEAVPPGLVGHRNARNCAAALVASSRQRCSSCNSTSAFGVSFFSG